MKTLKKALAVFLCAVLTLTAAPLSGFVGLELSGLFDFNAQAASYSGTCGDKLTWSLNTFTGVLNITGTGAMTNWSSISSAPWYSYRSSVKTVKIANGVTSIGSYAFHYCSSLTSVTIPDGITSIGSYAFYYCSSLMSVTIPDSVTLIGIYAFYGCDSLTDVYYGSTEVDWNKISIGLKNEPLIKATIHFTESEEPTEPTVAIGNCGDHLAWILYESGLLEITGTGAMTNWSSGSSVPWYRYNDDIKTVNVDDGVTTIGNYAFYYYYKKLTSIIISDSVTAIGNYAFYCCEGIKELTMPASAKIYNSLNTFYACCNIEKVTLTKGNGTMQNYSISSTENYTNTYYMYTPWCNSRINLKELVLEDGIRNIGECAFKDCDRITSVIIPDSVTTIGDYAFMYSNKLTSVTIPDSVTTIDECAFYGCLSLVSATIGKSVTTIGELAFYNCSSLTSITIPASVTSIGDQAFRSCSGLTSITIPASVTSIGDQAFTSCSGLTNITVDENNQYYSSDSYGVLFNKDKTTLIKYPASNTRTSYTIPDSVTIIGEYAFESCDSLTSVTIPDSITTIGDSAFWHCEGLTDVYYSSTEEDWNKIKISSDNKCLSNATIHYNFGKPLITPANGAVVDNKNGTIYGLDAGIDSLDNYTEFIFDGYEWSYDEGQYGFGTGTVATLKNGNEIIAEYTVLIFGDIDGNGWYDANDAFIVNMIASGLIDESRLSEAERKAADCNHDGVIDGADFYLLNQASLLLDDVDQSATQPELATNSVYLQYCSLIDQTAGVETNLVPMPDLDEAPSDSTADAKTEKPADEIDFEVIFTTIFDFIKKIFSLVLSFIVK